jgi:chromosome segregation ATPase
MPDLDEQLEAVIQRRKKLSETLERLRGRKEQAEENLQAVEAECREKNIDPDQIDSIIDQLESKYSTLVQQLTDDVAAAEGALQPYLGGNEA